MFAEQPSVKLCCQLCCSVFKDPVITTCGVSCPPGLCALGAPNRGAPGLAAQHVPSAVVTSLSEVSSFTCKMRKLSLSFIQTFTLRSWLCQALCYVLGAQR